jgi:hypothetical protein
MIHAIGAQVASAPFPCGLLGSFFHAVNEAAAVRKLLHRF